MAGFANDVVYANNGDFSIAGSNKGSLANGLLTDGQLWIGTTGVNAGGTHINVGQLVTANSTFQFGYNTPNISIDFNKTNMAIGTSMPAVTTGVANMIYGNNFAGSHITSGDQNILIGNGVARLLNSGSNNVFVGTLIAASSTATSQNVAIGTNTLATYGNGTAADGNIAIGYGSLANLTSGKQNIVLGLSMGNGYTSSESSNILIGNAGTTAESNVIRIGTSGSSQGQQNKAFIAGVAGVSVSNTNMVTIDTTTGQMGSAAVPGGFTAVNWSVIFSGNVSNVTGDGTDYAMLYNTTFFDSASGYNSGTGLYTFPTTGVYQINVLNFIFGGSVANTLFISYLRYAGAVNFRIMDANPGALGLAANGEFIQSATYLVSATAGDTIGVHVVVTGGAKDVGVAGGSSGCYFSGFRVA